MPAYSMYTGTSNGKWEGNTLVVETGNLKEEALLDAAGLPGSGALRVTERYTLQGNGQRLKTLSPSRTRRTTRACGRRRSLIGAYRPIIDCSRISAWIASTTVSRPSPRRGAKESRQLAPLLRLLSQRLALRPDQIDVTRLTVIGHYMQRI